MKVQSLLIIGLLLVVNPVLADEDDMDEATKVKVAPDFQVMDEDKDGVVSKEEFDAFRSTMDDGEEEEESSLSAFASFDKDKDGFVSEEELAAHAKYSNPGNGTGTLLDNKKQKSNANRKEKKEKPDRSDRGKNSDRGNGGGKDK